MPSFEITRLIHDTSCAISLLLNSLLIVLIFTKTPKELRILVADGFDLNAITGPCRLTGSPKLCFVAYVVMMHGHSHYCVLLAFGFCYRYYTMRFSSPTILRLILALVLVYTPSLLIYCRPNNSSEQRTVSNRTHPAYDYDSRASEEMLIGTETSAATDVGIAWTKGVIMPVYAIMITLSILIQRFLSSNLDMSKNSRILHRGVMKALYFQSLLPTLYFFASGLHFAREKRLIPEWSEAGYLPPTIGSITLAANPLCTLIYIQPYRIVILSMFFSRWVDSPEVRKRTKTSQLSR